MDNISGTSTSEFCPIQSASTDGFTQQFTIGANANGYALETVRIGVQRVGAAADFTLTVRRGATDLATIGTAQTDSTSGTVHTFNVDPPILLRRIGMHGTFNIDFRSTSARVCANSEAPTLATGRSYLRPEGDASSIELEGTTLQLPTASITASVTTVQAGETVELTATGTDPDGGTVTYAWETDGSGTLSSSSGSPVTYEGAGDPGHRDHHPDRDRRRGRRGYRHGDAHDQDPAHGEHHGGSDRNPFPAARCP